MKWLVKLLVLLLVIAVLLGAVAALFPARTALGWVDDRLEQVQFDDVGGTVWKGYAGEVRVRGQPIGRLGWSIHALSLLQARVDGDIALDGAGYRMQSAFSAEDMQTLHFRDATGEFPAERLNPALDIPGLVPVGRVQVSLAEATLVGGFPRSLRGDVLWRNAAVAGEAAANFGDLRAEFHTDAAGAVQGTVQDQGGPLALDGTFRIDFRGYEAEALLSARDGNPDVIKALKWIGEPLEDGSSLLKIEGRILPL